MELLLSSRILRRFWWHSQHAAYAMSALGGKRTLEGRVVNVTKCPNQPPVWTLSPIDGRDHLVAVPTELAQLTLGSKG